jgi:flagellar basal-body rod protein FlgG
MLRALYTAASGMVAQQLNLDNIANNLANSSTAGFYGRRLQFSDLVYQNVIMPGAAATQQTTVAAGLQVGLGTMPTASEVLQTQGNFRPTPPASRWGPTEPCRSRKLARPRPSKWAASSSPCSPTRAA